MRNREERKLVECLSDRVTAMDMGLAQSCKDPLRDTEALAVPFRELESGDIHLPTMFPIGCELLLGVLTPGATTLPHAWVCTTRGSTAEKCSV